MRATDSVGRERNCLQSDHSPRASPEKTACSNATRLKPPIHLTNGAVSEQCPSGTNRSNPRIRGPIQHTLSRGCSPLYARLPDKHPVFNNLSGLECECPAALEQSVLRCKDGPAPMLGPDYRTEKLSSAPRRYAVSAVEGSGRTPPPAAALCPRP